MRLPPSRGLDWKYYKQQRDPESPTRSVSLYEGHETGAMDDSLYLQAIVLIDVLSC